MRLVAVLLVLAAVAANAALRQHARAPCVGSRCGGMLGAIYHVNGSDTADDCCFINVPTNGVINVRSMVPELCLDADPNAGFRLPQTHYGFGTDRLFFTSGSGKFVHSVNAFTGERDAVPWGTLPAQYDFLIGIAYTAEALWVVSISTVYKVSAQGGSCTPLYSIATYGLTSNAVVTSSDDSLFFAENSLLLKLSLATGQVTTINMNPVKKPMDLAFYSMNNTLLIVDTYRLFAVNPDNGLGSQVMAIPNGPGFPRVNTLRDTTWQFCDFTRLYTTDLQAEGGPTITTTALFNSIPLVGYFQYFY